MTVSIPDNEPKPTQPKKPGFRPGTQDKIRQQARAAALKARISGAKTNPGGMSAHEQHVAHQEHLTAQRNAANRNMKSKNPYNT
jgi:hypothetical protein